MTRTVTLGKYVKVLSFALLLVLFLGVVSTPVLGSHGGPCHNDPAVCLCEDASSAADPLQIFFTIMSVLGPVFGSLFYVGLSVAGAAQMKDEYKDQRRRVLLLGFSVPIAISFLNVIGNKLVQDQSLDCFFP